MFGWRARIGVVYPASVVENLMVEFFANVPDGMSLAVHTLEVEKFADYRADGLRRQVLRGVDLVAAREVDCLAVAGAPFANALGVDGEQALLDEIEDRAGVPAFTTQSAAADAMRALGVTDIALPAPYDLATSQPMIGHLEAQGFTIRARELDSEILKLHHLSLNVVYRHIRDTVREFPSTEAIYIPGAQFPIPPAPLVEADFGRPLIYATHALIWTACMKLGIRDETFAGKGALLETLRPDRRPTVEAMRS